MTLFNKADHAETDYNGCFFPSRSLVNFLTFRSSYENSSKQEEIESYSLGTCLYNCSSSHFKHSKIVHPSTLFL